MRTPIQNNPFAFLVALLALTAFPVALFAQTAGAAPANKGFVTVKEILDQSCSACHDWTASWETITGGGKVVPGSPDQSLLYQKIASDEMPMKGDKLTADQKAFIRGWIAAGAPATDLPISVPAAEQAPGAAPSDGASAAAPSTAPAPSASPSFLFFPNKVAFHEVTGFTATAMFIGAGVIGVVHFLDMMNEGHYLRDQAGFVEGGPESTRIPLVQQAWGSDAALRWWHVGFIVTGETLYLGDAITGISMMTKGQPGKVTRSDIHRYAFFTHVSLMAAQIILGFFETSALSSGNHDLMIGLGAAHAAIGVAIPLVMLGAGLENVLQ
jgi:hypothetical protein